MKRSQRLHILLVLIFLSLGLNAQSGNRILLPHEPTPNLGKLKTQLRAYHDCTASRGCYVAELNRQSDRAISILQRRVAKAKSGEKLALVLDIDETALSSWDEQMQDDFGFIARDWNEWASQPQAPVIAGTLRLYNEAQKNNVSVFFITGRADTLEAVTSENLKKAGYDHWARLALRGPHTPEQTVTEYKSGERKRLLTLDTN
jgi:HAD superfamily, subfamily IIIB (Acid phosphatase)